MQKCLDLVLSAVTFYSIMNISQKLSGQLLVDNLLIAVLKRTKRKNPEATKSTRKRPV